MPPDALAADTGTLTIDQAIQDITEVETKEDVAPADAEAAPETELEVVPTAEDADEPETATDSDDAETDEAEEAETPDLPPIAPPPFWDAAAKERFGDLPRDLQELVLAKEAERDTATSKKIEEAALKSKAADAEASRIAQVTGVLDKLLPQAIQTFKSRWDGVDWNKVIDEQGAEAALKFQNDMQREKDIVQQLQAAKADADQVKFAKFVEVEAARLVQLAPELADPKLGPQRKSELGKFLISSGVPAAAIPNMTANEASIAYDAMRWRNAQAQAKAKTSNPTTPAKSAAQPARPSVKPTAAPGQRNPQTMRLKSFEAAFDKDPSVENLEALLNAQGT